MKEKKPIIIAHRGASAFAPENTMAAFKKAYELNADGIEFDVKLSKDGEMVIIHDQTLDRTTNGHGKVIETKLKDLRSLDAGCSYSESFAGERIPLLCEVLEEFSDFSTINIEITNYASITDGLANKICKLVKDMRLERNVIFSSFHPYNLLVVRNKLPQVPAALLALPGKSGNLTRSNLLRWLSPDFIHPYYKDVTGEYIEKQHDKSRKVNVWTVDIESDIKKVFEDGVDGIITDNPLLVRRVLDS